MSQSHICPHCGQANYPISKIPSSFVAELGIWLLCGLVGFLIGFWTLIIALGFSFWRMFAKTRSVCPSCNQEGMIPLNTPKGKALFQQYAETQSAQ